MAKTIAVADQQTTGIDRMKSQPQRADRLSEGSARRNAQGHHPYARRGAVDHPIVIACVFIFAAYFALVDFVVGQGVTQLIPKFTKH